MLLNRGVRDCVGFVTECISARKSEPGSTHDYDYDVLPRGTVFMVYLPDGFTYMVTARHVAEKIENRVYLLRLNSQSSKKSVLIDTGNFTWFYHPDKTVDVAVCPFRVGESTVDCGLLDSNTFLNEKIIAEKNIGAGDQVFIVGLFSNFLGRERNIPIIRMGNVAMMENELINTELGAMEGYLIEARSIGGMSGSPVFVHHQQPGSPYPGGVYIMGLIHGHWGLPIGDSKDSQKKQELLNVGISIVVPASKIIEVLYLPELVNMRREATERARKNKAPS